MTARPVGRDFIGAPKVAPSVRDLVRKFREVCARRNQARAFPESSLPGDVLEDLDGRFSACRREIAKRRDGLPEGSRERRQLTDLLASAPPDAIRDLVAEIATWPHLRNLIGRIARSDELAVLALNPAQRALGVVRCEAEELAGLTEIPPGAIEALRARLAAVKVDLDSAVAEYGRTLAERQALVQGSRWFVGAYA